MRLDQINRVLPKEIQDKRDSVTLAFDYSACTHIISSLGKFQGEPIFVPYYWNMGLEGFSDEDTGTEYRFKFANGCEDFTIWPELKEWLGRKRTLRLWEDSVGFVHSL